MFGCGLGERGERRHPPPSKAPSPARPPARGSSPARAPSPASSRGGSSPEASARALAPRQLSKTPRASHWQEAEDAPRLSLAASFGRDTCPRGRGSCAASRAEAAALPREAASAAALPPERQLRCLSGGMPRQLRCLGTERQLRCLSVDGVDHVDGVDSVDESTRSTESTAPRQGCVVVVLRSRTSTPSGVDAPRQGCVVLRSRTSCEAGRQQQACGQ